jgi:hypothetical protein
MLLDTSKERVDISMQDMLEQLNKAVETGYRAGQANERNLIANWLLKLAEYPCLKPNWEQIAADVRKGLDKLND